MPDTTEKLPKHKEPVAHIICNSHDEPIRVSLIDDDAYMADIEGLSVTTNACAEEIIDAIGPLPASEFMSDAVWQEIAPKLRALSDHYKANPTNYYRPPAVMPLTSPELPDELIPARMYTLGRIYNAKLDLEAYIELNELAFSRTHSRAANPALFREDSWKCDWTSIYQEDPNVLDERANAISEAAAENRSEAAAFGDGPPGSYRSDCIGDLEIREIDFAIRNYFGPEEESESSITDSDIPY